MKNYWPKVILLLWLTYYIFIAVLYKLKLPLSSFMPLLKIKDVVKNNYQFDVLLFKLMVVMEYSFGVKMIIKMAQAD